MAASVATSSKSISGFDPRSLSGCVLWLDADDPYTLFSDAGGTTLATTTVNAWKDKSASALLFAGGTAGPTLIKSTTVNSRPYLSFNGTSNYLLNTSMSVSQPYTIYVVAYLLGNTNNYYRLLTGLSAIGSNGNLVVGSQGGNFAVLTGNGTNFNDTNAITPLTSVYTVWAIYSATVTGATVNSFLNGLALNSKTGTYIASTLTGFNIAGGNSLTGFAGVSGQFFVGNVGEILMYNYVLSASQRQQVEGYLAWKWGMTSASTTKPTAITLPITHSFSIIQPFSRSFTPLDVPGCALWLDAADKSTFILSGGNITTWNDKSSTANNFTTTAGTATNITDGGYSVVSFPSGTIMTSTSTLTWTTSSAFFVVSKIISIPSGQYADYIIGFSSIINADFSIRVEPLGLCGTPAPTIPPNVNDLSIYNYYVNGSLNPNFPLSTYQSYNIIHTGNPSQAGTSVMTLSTIQGRYLVGNIAEVLYYPAGVTSIQRQQIESYLAWKWGITLATTSQPTFVTTFAYNGTTQTNGTIQSWLCPTGVTSVTVYVWGAAGGGAYPPFNVSGGAGAFVTGTWTTTPGTTYYIAVGGGGLVSLQGAGAIAGGWPGGGSSGTSGAAGGGGYSGIFTGSTPSQANAIVIAGGGGGGGPDPGSDWGGSAYYSGTSQNGGQNLGTGGYGGSLTAGGAAGGTGATAGTALQGGNGNGYSAGGGGGYFGGGGGYYLSSADGCSGGGGGSSYSGGLINPTGINSPNATGKKTTSGPGSSYQYCTKGIAESTAGQNGGNGLVVIVSASNQYKSYPPSAPTPFYPTHIQGCVLWLDAADSSTINGSVSWNDKSGNKNNAMFSGSVTYASNTVSTSSTSYFSAPVDIRRQILPNMSIFIVYQYTPNTSLNTALWGCDNGGGWNRLQILNYVASTVNQFGLSNGNGTNTINNINTSSTLIYGAFFNLTTVTAFVNGASAVTAFAETTNSPILDQNIYFGTISPNNFIGAVNYKEIIIYNNSITSGQRQQVESYLSSKWGISLTTNPYSKFTPSQLSPPVGINPTSSSFTPTSITGCQLWMDASQDTTTLGTNVSTIPDKSGINNTLTPLGSISRIASPTLNNYPVYYFGGSRATCNSFSWGTSFTHFVVSSSVGGTWLNSVGTLTTYVAPGNWALMNVNSTTSFEDPGGANATAFWTVTNGATVSVSNLTLSVTLSTTSNSKAISSGTNGLYGYGVPISSVRQTSFSFFLPATCGTNTQFGWTNGTTTITFTINLSGSAPSSITCPGTSAATFTTVNNLTYFVFANIYNTTYTIIASSYPGGAYTPSSQTATWTNSGSGVYQFFFQTSAASSLATTFTNVQFDPGQGCSVLPRSTGLANAWNICCAGYTSGSTTMTNYTVNGNIRSSWSSAAYSGTTPALTLYIGGSSGGNYDTNTFAEIIHYNVSLTSTQRQQVEGYLAWKWGLQNTLSSSHPYRYNSTIPSLITSGTNITASWTESPDAYSYAVKLYSQTSSTSAYTLVSSTTQNALSISYTRTLGLLYTVYVSAIDSAGSSSPPVASIPLQV